MTARRTVLAVAVAAVAVPAMIAAAVATAPTATPEAMPTPPPAAGATPPPWTAPVDPRTGIEAAGLRISRMTGDGDHFHAHLAVVVDGQPVPVPANIGVSAVTGQMSELHTHDPSGLLHLESDVTGDRYVLGQLFTQWGVRLEAGRLGALTDSDGRALTAYVDGERYDGDPAQIELLPRRQIALVFGTTAQQATAPAGHRFQPGD